MAVVVVVAAVVFVSQSRNKLSQLVLPREKQLSTQHAPRVFDHINNCSFAAADFNTMKTLRKACAAIESLPKVSDVEGKITEIENAKSDVVDIDEDDAVGATGTRGLLLANQSAPKIKKGKGRGKDASSSVVSSGGVHAFFLPRLCI